MGVPLRARFHRYQKTATVSVAFGFSEATDGGHAYLAVEKHRSQTHVARLKFMANASLLRLELPVVYQPLWRIVADKYEEVHADRRRLLRLNEYALQWHMEHSVPTAAVGAHR